MICRLIILTPLLHTLHHHVFLHSFITIMSLLHLQHCQKTTDGGHRVTSGMSWLICLKQPWQQRASVCTVCVRQRVNTPTFTSSLVWILSLLPLTRQLFYVCLLFQRLSWLPHTQAVSEVRPPVFGSGGRWMGLAHLWEVEKTHKVWCNTSLFLRFYNQIVYWYSRLYEISQNSNSDLFHLYLLWAI